MNKDIAKVVWIEANFSAKSCAMGSQIVLQLDGIKSEVVEKDPVAIHTSVGTEPAKNVQSRKLWRKHGWWTGLPAFFPKVPRTAECLGVDAEGVHL